jgi:hypothetical protein
MTNKSRLSRHNAARTKKQLVWILIGSTVLLYLLFQFGLWAITNISGFFIALNEKNESSQNAENTSILLTPPTINTLTDATSSATIAVTGRSQDSEGSIQIFVNDKKVEDLEVKKDGSFEGKISGLKTGENAIKARFVTKNGDKSDFSREQTILYAKDAPKIDDLSPADNSEFKREEDRIEVSGKTSPDAKVYVNDFIAIVDESGGFSYMLKLSEGDNLVKVKAENEAGLTSEKTIRVIYRP